MSNIDPTNSKSKVVNQLFEFNDYFKQKIETLKDSKGIINIHNY